jgi:type I restriction enzyme S subunit
VEDLNNCEKYQETAREYGNENIGLIPRGSVIFPKRGAAIALNKIRLSNRELLMDTNMMALTPITGCMPEFLFYLISQVGLDQIADSSTIPQINNKHIIPFSVLVPSPEEQGRIADCLTSLDALITNTAHELDTLKTHKKGLMQQIFPSAAALDA